MDEIADPQHVRRRHPKLAVDLAQRTRLLPVGDRETVQNFLPLRGNPLMRRPRYGHRKDLADRLMQGRSPGDLCSKTGMLSELTKALAVRVLSTEMDAHLDEGRVAKAVEFPWRRALSM